MHAHHDVADLDAVGRALKAAHGLLPDQGPIGVFIHHNTLHALQHLPFEEAVAKGAELLGARTWPDMDVLREAWRAQKLEDRDVDAELSEALGERAEEKVALGLSRRELWRALMREPLDVDDAPGIAFVLGEDETYQAALAKVSSLPRAQLEQQPMRRHRDVLLALGGEDTDTRVHPELIRLGIAFLDLGQARVRIPGRDKGFLRAAAKVLAAAGPRGVREDMSRVLEENVPARVVLEECLAALGVEGDEVEPWLLAEALALPGVAGMFSRLERHPEEGDAPASLLEFLAVRLVFQRRAVEHAALKLKAPVKWTELQKRTPPAATRPLECDAYLLTRLAQLGKADLRALSEADVAKLFAEVAAFPRARRNYLLFLASERAYRRRVLTGIHALQQTRKTFPIRTERPRAQVMFCIDEREESIHRMIEELDPSVETLAAAGFFGMAIDYQGVDDHAPAAYCPVVVTPAHEVHESPLSKEKRWHAVRARMRAAWHAFERSVGSLSRTLFGGTLASGFGPFAFALALGRVNAPRASLRVWDRLTTTVARPPQTHLLSLRRPNEVAEIQTKKPLGFSLEEAADRVTAMLKNVGLVRNQARLIFVLGHGSTSLNNPHESAHDCGACGGRRGGANARLFAELANRPDVRALVKARGVSLPDDTWFVGGLHDTADDGIDLFDTDAIPPTHLSELAELEKLLDRARRESAQERCRRFLNAPLGISPDDALAHVEVRASHLGQPRPEYGHCTNASAVVGRRTLTRGLHLDRRCFLVSYDPEIDQNDAILERILAAVGPVGAGISLEYWFSSVDNEVYGCGTKLPHNVTGLLGVMNGHQGDLRTGLPLQMVELHEPLRLLLIVEASPESLLGVAGRQAEVRELVVNRWVHLVSVHPKTGAITYFDGKGFVPFVPDPEPVPVVERSVDWHGQARDFVRPAIVKAALR